MALFGTRDEEGRSLERHGFHVAMRGVSLEVGPFLMASKSISG